MTNPTPPANNEKDNLTADTIPSARGVVIQNEPRGFGPPSASPYSDQRREELRYDDPFPPGMPPNGQGNSYQAPGGPANNGPTYDKAPYPNSFVIFHHGPGGVRLQVQARTRTFVLAFLILVIVLNLPGFGDRIFLLVKTLLTGN